MIGKNQSAALQYAGLPGISQSCLDAVMRFVQFGDSIERVVILSSQKRHALLISISPGDWVAIKSGFGSGYQGAGPRALAVALRILETFCDDIEECDINSEILDALDDSALTKRHLSHILDAGVVRPRRWCDYIYDVFGEEGRKSNVNAFFPETMPWAIVDMRIFDLALLFINRPSEAILSGFKRLEDLVRKRLSSDEHGAKLFSRAYVGEESVLCWEDAAQNENTARGQVFVQCYSAFRNPRAHRENASFHDLSEFLLLNHLFLLEAASVDRLIAQKS